MFPVDPRERPLNGRRGDDGDDGRSMSRGKKMWPGRRPIPWLDVDGGRAARPDGGRDPDDGRVPEFGLHRYDESSECATARQHNVVEVTWLPTREDTDGGTSDTPSKGGPCTTIRVPRVHLKTKWFGG